MSIITEIHKTALAQDGYTVIKQLLTKEEILLLRQILSEYFERNNPYTYYSGGKTQSNAMGHIPALHFLLDHPKISEVVKSLIGDGARFLHHSDAHYNMLGGWHKDTDGYIQNAWETRDAQQKIGVYKIAFYLQDHLHDKNGFSLRKGSHLRPVLGEGELVDIHSEAGDAVFFDQRLDHVGQIPSWMEKAVMKIWSSGQAQFNILHRIRRMQQIPDKFSVFIGFGNSSAFSEEFTKNTIARQNKQNKQVSYQLSEQAAKALDAVGLLY